VAIVDILRLKIIGVHFGKLLAPPMTALRGELNLNADEAENKVSTMICASQTQPCMIVEQSKKDVKE
jgi:hypothetical protein